MSLQLALSAIITTTTTAIVSLTWLIGNISSSDKQNRKYCRAASLVKIHRAAFSILLRYLVPTYSLITAIFQFTQMAIIIDALKK